MIYRASSLAWTWRTREHVMRREMSRIFVTDDDTQRQRNVAIRIRTNKLLNDTWIYADVDLMQSTGVTIRRGLPVRSLWMLRLQLRYNARLRGVSHVHGLGLRVATVSLSIGLLRSRVRQCRGYR